MSIIEKYIDAALNKDYEAISRLFTKHGHYNDYTPIGALRQEYHVYGREAIAMFFRNKFFFRQFSFSSPKILNDHQIEFVASYGNYYIVALANIEYAEDGQILRMIVRAR